MKNNKSNHNAFTMMELIFVIVIMAILAKFGIEFLAQAYRSFINSKINNELQSNSLSAVEYISNKLQYRIKPSIIAREANNSFTPLKDYSNATAPILEWIGSDIDGFRGTNKPYWSGIIDLNASSASQLISPETNTTQINNLINILSNGTSTIDDAAIYFVGSPIPMGNQWGWNGVAIADQNQSIHPIEDNATVLTALKPKVGTFANTKAYEFYQLAWTAYAVGIDDYNATTHTGTLTLWYDYQPWQGEQYNDIGRKSVAIMQNVSSFRFIAVDSLIKIQVCVKDLLLTNEEYSICKEKTIF